MTLAKATITPEDGGGDALTVMFNPDHYVFDRTNNWSAGRAQGQNTPQVRFTSGGSTSLQMDLIFDTTDTGEDVRAQTGKLADMMLVKSNLTQGAHQSRPPKVRFAWGPMISFLAAIQRLQLTFQLFLENGTPVRAKASVTFLQVDDPNARPWQNPTSGGVTGERIHRLGPRETLELVAYTELGDASLWRPLAAFNGIDDPLRLRPGAAVLLPPSVDDLKGFG